MLEHFLAVDFENAMDIFKTTDKKDRQEHWMFDLIMVLGAINTMGEERVSEMMGADEFAKVMGRR